MAISVEESKNLVLNFLKPKIIDGSVIYIVKVSDPEESWEISTRYSQLREIHLKMKDFNKELPNFPGKKLFGNLNDKFISERQGYLNHYMHVVLGDPSTYKNAILYDFMTRGKQKKTQTTENEPDPVPKAHNAVSETKPTNTKPTQSQELYQEFKHRLMQIPKKNEIAAWIDEEDKRLRH